MSENMVSFTEQHISLEADLKLGSVVVFDYYYYPYLKVRQMYDH